MESLKKHILSEYAVKYEVSEALTKTMSTTMPETDTNYNSGPTFLTHASGEDSDVDEFVPRYGRQMVDNNQSIGPTRLTFTIEDSDPDEFTV